MWKELWLRNYRGEGDCQELVNAVKQVGFGQKTNANYLPWAVVERIFKLQGGEYETLKNEKTNSIVDADKYLLETTVDSNGVVYERFANSYYVNVRVTWLGQVYVEHYPLQDANGKPLQMWTQNDLNKSVQRAKTKAIAIVSGIGYKLYEDGDLQFDDDDTKTSTNNNTKTIAKNTVANAEKLKQSLVSEKKAEISVEQVAPKNVEKTVKQPEKTVDPNLMEFDAEIEVDEEIEIPTYDIQEKVEDKKTKEELAQFVMDTFVANKNEHQKLIRNFMKEHDVKSVKELAYDQLFELVEYISVS